MAVGAICLDFVYLITGPPRRTGVPATKHTKSLPTPRFTAMGAVVRTAMVRTRVLELLMLPELPGRGQGLPNHHGPDPQDELTRNDGLRRFLGCAGLATGALCRTAAAAAAAAQAHKPDG